MSHSVLPQTNEIEELFIKLSRNRDSHNELGAMSCSIYDTAWVSAVAKTVAGTKKYLFPSSFLIILEAQLPDGSWDGHFHQKNQGMLDQNVSVELEVSSSRSGDRIISTMAALYTMNLHAASPLQIPVEQLPSPPLTTRIASAVSVLHEMLHHWDVVNCNTVGIEVLCPSLLGLLSSQGYDFAFPARRSLFEMRDSKLARVTPKMIYQVAPSALLHSLEAFHDWNPNDFDVSKVRHHLVGGSMMASPAATASYLIKMSPWDEDAELYLSRVIQYGEGLGSGAVPSAYPSTNFETLWACTRGITWKLF